MIYLSEFIPHYCPSCGTPTRFQVPNNPDEGRFKALQALNCVTCGVWFQRATQKDLLRAATASGGDLLEYYVVGKIKSSKGTRRKDGEPNSQN